MKTYQVKSVHLESKVWLGANSTTHLKLSKIALENVAHSRDMTDHFFLLEQRLCLKRLDKAPAAINCAVKIKKKWAVHARIFSQPRKLQSQTEKLDIRLTSSSHSALDGVTKILLFWAVFFPSSLFLPVSLLLKFIFRKPFGNSVQASFLFLFSYLYFFPFFVKHCDTSSD